MLRITVLLLLLLGCSAFDSPDYRVVRHISTIETHEDPLLGPYSRAGYARVVGDKCYITLREYPICLKHEVRHCYEGAWHGNEISSDDCY